MQAEIVQAEYDRLENIAGRFAAQSEAIAGMLSRVKEGVDGLGSGGWEGRGSDAFLAEMEGEIIPATSRLESALTEADQVTRKISEIIRKAEEEAARIFGGDGGVSTGQPVGPGGGSIGGEGVVTGQPVGPAGGSLPPSSDLVQTDPSRIFDQGYMENFIGSDFQGSGSPRLNSLMEQLMNADPNDPRTGRILDEIADIRGVDRAQFRDQYEKYLILRENGNTNGGNYPDIDLNTHGDFLGSKVSLRYGSLVGEVFGVDPVFGSLLNPTGGLVGAGSESYWPGENDAIGYHGTFHDAAGYLYNYQKIGPGYDYMNREPFDTGNPLSGQVGGISWWVSHPELSMDIPVPSPMIPDIPYVPSFLEQPLIEGVSERVRYVATTVEGGMEIGDGIGDVFSGNFREGFSDIGSGGARIVKGFGRSVIDWFD